MAHTGFSSLTLVKIHYSKHIDSQNISDSLIKEFVQGQPFRLTDVDLHEVINILNIIIPFP